MKLAFLFPGQGSQYVGMGRALYEASPAARRTFEEADSVLGFALGRLCFEGPEEELRRTDNAQPALLTVSMACLAALGELNGGAPPQPLAVAGHSLGEYTALVAAGALSFADGVRLVRQRGWLMHEAGRQRPGGMAAVLGLDAATVERVCQQAGATGIVAVANYNAADQVVLSGEPLALQRAGELAREQGARRVIPLAVSGAFHSPLMELAAHHFASVVAACPIADAQVAVIANTTAQPLKGAAALREELVCQLGAPVRWAESMDTLAALGAGLFVEVGPGQVLTGLLRRRRDSRTANIDSLGAAEAFLRGLEGGFGP